MCGKSIHWPRKLLAFIGCDPILPPLTEVGSGEVTNHSGSRQINKYLLWEFENLLFIPDSAPKLRGANGSRCCLHWKELWCSPSILGSKASHWHSSINNKASQSLRLHLVDVTHVLANRWVFLRQHYAGGHLQQRSKTFPLYCADEKAQAGWPVPRCKRRFLSLVWTGWYFLVAFNFYKVFRLIAGCISFSLTRSLRLCYSLW